jgi:hypothetical protein
MKVFKNLGFCCVVLLIVNLYACKIRPQSTYLKIAEKATAHINELAPSNPTHLTVGEFKKLALNLSDSAALVVDTGSKRASLYKAFLIDLQTSGEHMVEVEAICDCIGLYKPMFEPMIVVKNSKNKLLDVELIDEGILEPSFSLAARLKRSWKFFTDEGGPVNIIVYSDNRMLDKKFGENTSPSYFYTANYSGYVNVKTEFHTDAKGKFRIRVK